MCRHGDRSVPVRIASPANPQITGFWPLNKFIIKTLSLFHLQIFFLNKKNEILVFKAMIFVMGETSVAQLTVALVYFMQGHPRTILFH